nr:MAG TPA: hypothetical protein [Caudoviricetes sp.]
MLLTIGFLSYALEVSLIFISWSIPTQLGVHFQSNKKATLIGLLGTLGKIIFIHLLRSTLDTNLSQSSILARC